MSDRFESDYMADEASVRHRDKRVSRWMTAMLAGPAVFVWGLAVFLGFANSGSARPVPAAALPFVLGALVLFGLMFALLSLTFAVLRTVVTDRAVIVKYGLWGPEIALDTIQSCRVVDYAWTNYGGFGIRKGIGGGWAYVPGPGEVVEIAYTEGAATKTVQIGAADARKLALEINRARHAHTQLRVEASDERAHEETAAAEEALAEESLDAEEERHAER